MRPLGTPCAQNDYTIIHDSAGLNPKHEIRNSKQSQMTKFQRAKTNQELGRFEF